MASKTATKKAAQRSVSRKPSGADVIRIGLQAATAKANLPHSEWAGMVNAAHAKGITVASAIDPNIPDALKARTKTSLRAESQKTVGDLYKPQEAELDYATQQANGLQAKRLTDETAFNSWYAQKVGESNQRASDAQKAYQDAVTGQATKQSTEGPARVTDLQAQIQQGAGGDMSNSVYLKDALAREQTRTDNANVASTGAIQSGITTANNMAGNTASIAGRHDAAVGGIVGDYGKSMQDITGSRLKLASSKAADIIKSYTDALDTEASKANSQQQYTGLMAQLGQKADAASQQNDQYYAGLQLKDKTSKRSAATSKANAQTSADASIKVAGINSGAKQLDRDLKKAEGTRNRNLQLRIAKMNNQTNSDGTPSDSAIKYSQSQVQVIHTVASIIKKYGSKFRDANHNVTDTRTALISRGYSGPQINAGLWLAQKGHINDDLAKQLGILPQQRG